jgi:hypothetical protein
MPVDCHLDRFGFGHGEPIFVGDVIHTHDLFPRCQSIVSAPAERRQLCRLVVIANQSFDQGVKKWEYRRGSIRVTPVKAKII